MAEPKKDAQGNLLDDKGNIVDEKGNIIQKAEEGLKLEGLPENIKGDMPKNFDTLPKDDQVKLVDMAKKAHQVDEKERLIQERSTELGDLRKFKTEAEPILQAIKAQQKKGVTDPELETLLTEAKKRGYDDQDVEFFQKFVTYKNKQDSKAMREFVADFVGSQVAENVAKDPEIDEKIFNDNQKDIDKEYDRYKAPKTTKEARELYKEAALKVQSRIVAAMSEEAKKDFEAKRSARISAIPGMGPKPPKTKDARTPEEKQASPEPEDIRDAGGKKKEEGVFG